MDYEKQTEDFRGEGEGERDRLVMGSKEGTECYTQLMKHQTLHRNPGMCCMVMNII